MRIYFVRHTIYILHHLANIGRRLQTHIVLTMRATVVIDKSRSLLLANIIEIDILYNTLNIAISTEIAQLQVKTLNHTLINNNYLFTVISLRHPLALNELYAQESQHIG